MMRFFQNGDLVRASENRPDKQSDEELSACLEGTHWSKLPFEMRAKIIKQVLSITFKLLIENPYFGRKVIKGKLTANFP